MADDVLTYIREQAREVLDADPATITRTTSLAEEYDADSVDVIEIASAVEHHYGVVLEDHEVYELTCVGDFVDLVEAKLAAKA